MCNKIFTGLLFRPYHTGVVTAGCNFRIPFLYFVLELSIHLDVHLLHLAPAYRKDYPAEDACKCLRVFQNRRAAIITTPEDKPVV